MAKSKDAVDGIATATFSKYTPNTLKTTLGGALNDVLTCAGDLIQIN